jgi:hypothetical protein
MRLAEQKLDLHILLNCDNRSAFGSSRAGSPGDAEITFDELGLLIPVGGVTLLGRLRPLLRCPSFHRNDSFTPGLRTPN